MRRQSKLTGEVRVNQDIRIVRCTERSGGGDKHHLELEAGDGFDGLIVRLVVRDPDALIATLREGTAWLAEESA